MKLIRNNLELIISILLVTLLVSCSHEISYKVLNFLFDGVPVRDTVNTTNSPTVNGTGDTSKIFREVPFEADEGFTVHYPYKEKECYSCHDENAKSELILPQPDLCYLCHSDYTQEYKYMHGPVAGGYCTECHNPHMSGESRLLIRSGQRLCTECHEIKSVFKNDAHSDIEDTECTLCHNPHGGDNNYFLN